MTVTKEELAAILDEKLAGLKNELIASFAKDLLKEVNGLKSTINNVKTTANNALSKVKHCDERIKSLEEAEPRDVTVFEERISKLESAEPCNLTHLESALDDTTTNIQTVRDDLVALKATVDKCNATLASQEETIEDLRNRQMRNTLVFKGIAESKDEHN